MDRLEQSEGRKRRQLDASPQKRWKDIDGADYGMITFMLLPTKMAVTIIESGFLRLDMMLFLVYN